MMSGIDTYEMLWDCDYCDTKKLLGLTHRFCPTCGAPQDPSWRYFPSDADKVKVESHVFTGADRKCPACGNPSSAKAKCCSNCGSPLEEGASVAMRQDKFVAADKKFEGETEADAKKERAGASAVPAAPGNAELPNAGAASLPRSKLIAFGLLGVFAVAIVVVALMALWRKDVSITAVGHSWEREVRIESFGPVESNDWRGEIPAGAQILSCSLQQKGTRRVQDGEDCQIHKVDNGDGTFSEKRECSPRYREESENAEKCTYRVDKWAYSRSEAARGQGIVEAPAWPVVHLNMANTAVQGGEREVQRLERYLLHFNSHEGNAGTCELTEAQWRAISPGSRWQVTASVLGSRIDCEKMKPVQ